MIEEAIQKLDILLHGKIPDKIDTGEIADEGKEKLALMLNQLFEFMQETHEFIIPLARGELSEKKIAAKNFFGSPFKELHSRLLHLTWQAKQVGNGDFSQRISFMGDFSEAFNSMIVALDTNKKLITEKIDELKKAEKEASEERERLSITLRSIGDGVITTDLDGKIVLINKIAEQLTGWSQQEAVGRSVQDVLNIVNEKTGNPHEHPVGKILTSGKTVGLTENAILVARDDGRYSIEDNGAPIFDKESNMIGTVLVFRDVTEKKRIEKELHKVQKLESVGMLAGGIAHDFNNILVAVLGNIELAKMSADPSDTLYPLLLEAKKASLRAKDLTQQLLTFSKGGDPIKQTSSIGEIIVDSAKFVLHGNPVICDYNIPENLWKVDVDAGQMSHVIQNIILNACHAMPEGGEIKVSCENSDTKNDVPLPGRKYVNIIIADSGPGISEKIINNIFDPYFSTRETGSGLGLAICHSIISKHDGTISVQSTEGKGTTITICLPASLQTGQGAGVSGKGLTGPESKARILVMDDDVIVGDIIKGMLKRLGHEVLLVKDGHEAIALYNEHVKSGRSIDIIIMDLTIPGGMGGKEAVQEVLRINPDANVIVASGYSNDPVMAGYQEYGFKASIVKPFQMVELFKTINSCFEAGNESLV